MLIKLNFNSGTSIYPVNFFRALTAIINDNTITSVGQLYSSSIINSWSGTILAGLNTANSYIIRTDSPNTTNTVAHISRPATGSADTYVFEFVLQQKIYDNSNFYYTTVQCTTVGGAITKNVHTGITNAMNSSTWPVTVATSAATAAQGTTISPTSIGITNSISGANLTSTTGSCFFAYVSDTCFIFTMIVGSASPSYSGWPATTALTYTGGVYGPFVTSQYERRDYWNTSSTSIVPVFSDSGARNYNSIFGYNANDFSNIINTGSATAVEAAFSIHNGVANVAPGTTSTWAVASNGTTGVKVALGINGRHCDFAGFTSAGTGDTLTATTQTFTYAFSNTQGYKMPTADLTGWGYPLLPISFRVVGDATFYQMLGGDVTSKGKFYFFNGDFVPGDEYVWNNQTYVLWPVYANGFANRLAYAIPKA